jgi:hypothetical protein
MIQLALMVQSNFKCKICTRCFRDSYDLKRHTTRINKCLPIKNEKIPTEKISELKQSQTKLSGSVLAKNIDETLLEIDETLLGRSQNTPSKCEWCLKQFVYLKQHRCKLKDDPVRTMEIEQKMNLTFPSSNKKCRFCLLELSTTSNLKKHIKTCKIMEDYVITLQKNNINVNNGTIINGNVIVNVNINNGNDDAFINPFGQETTNHINNYSVINSLISKDKNGHPYDLASQMITEHCRKIRSIPENQNVKLVNAKDTYAKVHTGTNRVESVPTAKVVKTAFINSAKDLHRRKTDINVDYPQVFENKKSKEIFTDIGRFSIHGVDHPTIKPGAQREAKMDFRASLATV